MIASAAAAAMKIYTRQGDDGSTSLLGNRRVLKSDLRIEACGTLDELNAAIGVVVASLNDLAGDEQFGALADRLLRVQGELFVLGAHVAVAEGRPVPSSVPRLEGDLIARLEQEIDQAESQLEPLRSFILPGGSTPSAHLHQARAICRRAERLMVALDKAQSAPRHAIAYLNRLADWLFVQARLANRLAGIEDIPWIPEK